MCNFFNCAEIVEGVLPTCLASIVIFIDPLSSSLNILKVHLPFSLRGIAMREFKRVHLDGKGNDIISLDGKGNDMFFDRPQSQFASEEFEDPNLLWGSDSELEFGKNRRSSTSTGFKSSGQSTWAWTGADPFGKFLSGVKPIPATRWKGELWSSEPELSSESAIYYDLYNSDSQGQVTIGGLKSLLDDLKGKLDDMNELSEMTSLRLQMTMDRRSKFISTLSQMMKKISTTQDMLVQNKK